MYAGVWVFCLYTESTPNTLGIEVHGVIHRDDARNIHKKAHTERARLLYQLHYCTLASYLYLRALRVFRSTDELHVKYTVYFR